MTISIKVLKQKLLQHYNSKMEVDLRWSLLSIVILAISGILINILIGRYYGPDALGIFNQAYAIYIVVSQFSVFGLYMSTLKYTSEYSDQPSILSSLFTASIVTCGFISLPIASLFYFCGSLIGELFKSSDVGFAIQCIAPGIFFFSMNKVLLSFLNGKRNIKAYANFQSLRYLLILLILGLVIVMRWPDYRLTLSISIAEATLFFLLLAYTLKGASISFSSFIYWVKNHLEFGYKGVFSGALSEMNTRVDVLMIGYFSTDMFAGLYSMPAMLIEGVMQIGTVVRDNINPLITKLYTDNKMESFIRLVKQTKKIMWLSMSFLGIIGILVYPLFLNAFFAPQSFKGSVSIFAILMIFFVLQSGYSPFLNLLTQVGHPGKQSLLMFFSFILNCGLNWMLIPTYGIMGAAIATGTSWFLSIFILKKMTFKAIQVKI